MAADRIPEILSPNSSRFSSVIRDLVGPLAVTLVVTGLWMPGVNFGQREHILYWLVIPFSLVGWLRIVGPAPGRWVALGAGLAAGIGIALKPHFLALWLAIEVIVVLRMTDRPVRERIVRTETLAVLGVLIAYWSYVLVFTNWLPTVRLAAGTYESFFTVDRLSLVLAPGTVAIILCMWALFRTSGHVATLALVFAAAATGSWFGMVVQGKGWIYHHYPVWAFIVAAALLISFRFVCEAAEQRVDRNRLPVVVLTAIMAASLVRASTVAHRAWRGTIEAQLSDLVSYFEAGEPGASVLMLSDLVSDGFPLVQYSSLDWVSPFPSSWWIQAMYGASPGAVPIEEIRGPEEMAEVERQFFAMLAAALTESRPTYVLADTSHNSRFNGASFPYLAYLTQDSSFRAELSNYQPGPPVAKFAVWRRRPDTRPGLQARPSTGIDNAP
jgi:hypothetical protein